MDINTEIPVYDGDRISAGIVMCGPEQARSLRESCNFEGHQRDINDMNVERLASEMARGYFVAGTAVTFCVLPNKSMLLVNGNHTLEAISKSGVTLPLVFIYIKADDRESAGRIYARFDIHKARTWMDAARAVGIGDKPYVDKALAAMGFILAGFRSDSRNGLARYSRDARFGLLKEYDEALAMMTQIVNNGVASIRKLVIRQPVLAVALYTIKYRPSSAVKFWTDLVADDGLATTDPRKTLLRFLQATTHNTIREKTEMTNGTAIAWNAYMKGNPLQLIRPNALKTFRLYGTPLGMGEAYDEEQPELIAVPASRKPTFEMGVRIDGRGQAHPEVIYAGE